MIIDRSSPRATSFTTLIDVRTSREGTGGEDKKRKLDLLEDLKSAGGREGGEFI